MSNKVALITGAGRRLGAIITRHLHEASYNVVLHYRHSQKEAETLADELNAIRQNSAIAIQANLDETDTFKNLTQNPWNQLDLLVNNASTFFPTPLEDSTEEQWSTLFNGNVKGAYFLSAKLIPHLRKNKGHIINIIDIYAKKPLKKYPIYSMAKAALLMMTKSLALELAPDIRVNGISPGTTIWPEGVNSLDENRKKESLERTLLKQTADPNDIANAVLFFANSSTITGQILNVDSGKSVK